jgi:signal-transduction protein with cAMP-binding, CBS, and nucleotidyltransferase domain
MNPEDVRPLHIEGDDRLVRDIRTPVAKIAQTMVAGRIHRLLVTRGRRVVGIVTSLDLLKPIFLSLSSTSASSSTASIVSASVTK